MEGVVYVLESDRVLLGESGQQWVNPKRGLESVLGYKMPSIL